MEAVNKCSLPVVAPTKVKLKKRNYDGIAEEEILKKKLSDHLKSDLDIIIIGINPGLTSALEGHHYASPSNHFWKCMNLSGLTPESMTAKFDFKLLDYGIGFTNVVERTTRSSSDLKKQEIVKGCEVLLRKLQVLKPKIAVFNGKFIYEIFSKRKKFNYGLQPEYVNGTNTYIWVMPSSSARYAHLPSPNDKLPYYIALKNFRDYLNGNGPELNMKELIFPVKTKCSKMIKNNDDKNIIKSDYFPSPDPTPSDTIKSSMKRKHLMKDDQYTIESNLKVLRSIFQRTV